LKKLLIALLFLFIVSSGGVLAVCVGTLTFNYCSIYFYGNGYGVDCEAINGCDWRWVSCDSTPTCYNSGCCTGTMLDYECDGTINACSSQLTSVCDYIPGCTSKVCGNGLLESPNGLGQYEQCDDGNTVSGDGCTSDCKLPSTCNAYCLTGPGCGSGFTCKSTNTNDGICRRPGCPDLSSCSCPVPPSPTCGDYICSREGEHFEVCFVNNPRVLIELETFDFSSGLSPFSPSNWVLYTGSMCAGGSGSCAGVSTNVVTNYVLTLNVPVYDHPLAAYDAQVSTRFSYKTPIGFNLNERFYVEYEDISNPGTYILLKELGPTSNNRVTVEHYSANFYLPEFSGEKSLKIRFVYKKPINFVPLNIYLDNVEVGRGTIPTICGDCCVCGDGHIYNYGAGRELCDFGAGNGQCPGTCSAICTLNNCCPDAEVGLRPAGCLNSAPSSGTYDVLTVPYCPSPKLCYQCKTNFKWTGSDCVSILPCPSAQVGTNGGYTGCLPSSPPLGTYDYLGPTSCSSGYSCYKCKSGFVWDGSICIPPCPNAAVNTINASCLPPGLSSPAYVNFLSFYCSSPNTCYKCGSGYLWNGAACVMSISNSCTDTDGGISQGIFGTISGSFNGVSYSNDDFCCSDSSCGVAASSGQTAYIREFYCNGVLNASVILTCGAGTVCDSSLDKCVCPAGTGWSGSWCIPNCPGPSPGTNAAGCQGSAPSYSTDVSSSYYCSGTSCYQCNAGFVWSGSTCKQSCPLAADGTRNTGCRVSAPSFSTNISSSYYCGSGTSCYECNDILSTLYGWNSSVSNCVIWTSCVDDELPPPSNFIKGNLTTYSSGVGPSVVSDYCLLNGNLFERVCVLKFASGSERTCPGGSTCSDGACTCGSDFWNGTNCVQCMQDSHCAAGQICLSNYCVYANNCSDTDGGNAAGTFGTVSGYYNNNPYSNSDYCCSVSSCLTAAPNGQNKTHIREYFCNGALSTSIIHVCDGGSGAFCNSTTDKCECPSNIPRWNTTLNKCVECDTPADCPYLSDTCTSNKCCRKGYSWDDTESRCRPLETPCTNDGEILPDGSEYCCPNCDKGYNYSCWKEIDSFGVPV